MMSDCVTPRHSAVMERLRRRIELFRQHHTTCESRYDRASLERLELERQQTYALHQRCLQAKAKRSSKQRQSQPSAAEGPRAGATEGVEGPEQSRNSTLIALQETVKRKIERAGSPLGRDQVNGFGDSFPPSKKACLDNSATNGSPLDSKLGLSDVINGKHETNDRDTTESFHRKEMKQEPDDILPIMPPSGSGSNSTSLFPDLNLNEQEWSELMEELNCTVAYEDIQDILNDDFEDRKDPLDLAPAPGSDQTGGSGAGNGGAGSMNSATGNASGGRQGAQTLLPPDLSSIKTEFSPASLDSHSSSPLVNIRSAAPLSSSSSSSLPNSSPSMPPSSSSPALAPSQTSRPLQNLQNHLLPSKDLSPAQQLQQLAAQQQRQQQHIHGPLQHKPNQQGAKFQTQHTHPAAWTQMGSTAQSPLGGAFPLDKPTSPSVYQQDLVYNTDFNQNQKQLLLPSQPNKGSPKPGGFLQSGPSVMGHSLSHATQTAAQLNYNNTKPLSHFEASTPRAPSGDQSKTQLLNLLRQQQQQQQQQQHMKQKNMSYRPHLQQLAQDQNSFAAPPHGSTSLQQQQPAPGNTVLGGTHNNAAYLNSQAVVAAALKQQQQRQQQQQQYIQRQQLQQEKQLQQQDQQLKRHLSRPPPQYQDQNGQLANQSAFPTAQVNQFTGASQPMGGVASIGAPPSASRMFPQPQSMMGLSGASVAPPTNAPPPQQQPDMSSLTANGVYTNMSLQQRHQQPLYRQNLMMKTQNNAAILKQQQLGVRLPGPMAANLAAALNPSHQAPQNVTWNQQMANSQLTNQQIPNTQLTNQQLANQQLANHNPQLANHNPQLASTQLANQQLNNPANNAFNNPQNAFHLQQQRLPKMPQFSAATSRPLNAMNPEQQMMPRAPSLAQQTAQQQDLSAFGAGSNPRNAGLQCNQGYQVSRAPNAQQQQQISCGYNVAAGSFAEESELVDSLLKGQSTQEWMDDLDELLASHHQH